MIFSFESDTAKMVAIDLVKQAARDQKALFFGAVCKYFDMLSDWMGVNK